MPFDGLDYRPQNGLSLCSGGGGLDMGLQLAEPTFHTRCFVEWEPYPQSVILSAQRAGYFAPAPLWDDVTTFDGRAWRDTCDTILAGYPCQPFSAAGKRRGEDDERHLWPDVARIIREVGPRWVFLENVAGHITLGLETVLRELREMGFDVAAQPFSAAEVGASHERLRIFIVAYSKDNCRRLHARQRAERARAFEPAGGGRGVRSRAWDRGLGDGQSRGRGERGDASLTRGRGYPDGASPPLGHTLVGAGELRRDTRDVQSEGQGSAGAGSARTGPESRAAGADVADTVRGRTPAGSESPEQSQDAIRAGRGSRAQPSDGSGCVADATGPQREGRGGIFGEDRPVWNKARRAGSGGRRDDVGPAGNLADSAVARLEGQRPDRDPQRRQEPNGSARHMRGAGIFPPGPKEAVAWLDVVSRAPDLAPAVSRSGVIQATAIYLASVLDADTARSQEPSSGGVAASGQLSAMGGQTPQVLVRAASQPVVRGISNGMAERTRALKLLGNGVCPLAAANAFRHLSRDLGLVPLDMDALGGV